MVSEINDVTETLPVVTLTESAVSQVKTLQAADAASAGKPLRLYIEQGGCSGMQYGMVFDEMRPEDLVAKFDGLSIVVDPISAQYLRGTRMDYSDNLNAGGFRISNPNARESCGCGKSFTA